MASSKTALEQRIRDAMKGNAVIVAVFPKESRDLDAKQAAKEFRPQVKRAYREQQMEILNCKHPTMYQTEANTLIFAVKDDLKSDEDYFKSFLNACQDDDVPVFIGIRTNSLY